MEKKFHVILTDELGEEFSVELIAHNMQAACDMVKAEYTESSIASIRELKPYNREHWSWFTKQRVTQRKVKQ